LEAEEKLFINLFFLLLCSQLLAISADTLLNAQACSYLNRKYEK